MFGLMFAIRYQNDGMWTTTTTVAYFPNDEERAQFAALPVVTSYRELDEKESAKFIAAVKSGD